MSGAGGDARRALLGYGTPQTDGPRGEEVAASYATAPLGPSPQTADGAAGKRPDGEAGPAHADSDSGVAGPATTRLDWDPCGHPYGSTICGWCLPQPHVPGQLPGTARGVEGESGKGEPSTPTACDPLTHDECTDQTPCAGCRWVERQMT